MKWNRQSKSTHVADFSLTRIKKTETPPIHVVALPSGEIQCTIQTQCEIKPHSLSNIKNRLSLTFY